MQYFRTIDADYVLVGLHRDIGSVITEASATLRKQTLRVGFITLDAETALPPEMLYLLSGAAAVGVVRRAGVPGDIAGILVDALTDQSRTGEWPRFGRIPRVYSTSLEAGSLEGQLLSFVKKMHTYRLEPLVAGPRLNRKEVKKAPLSSELTAVA